MNADERRALWVEYWTRQEETGYRYTGEPFPPELIGMTCGAKNRAGKPCGQKSLYRNGRCKFHGGMATGPTSEAGKEQARINGKKGGRPRKNTGVKTETHGNTKETPRVADILAREELASAGATQREAEIPKSMGCLKKLTFSEQKSAGETHRDSPLIVGRLCRCADCRNLSDEWECMATAKRNHDQAADHLSSLMDVRRCEYFRGQAA